MATTSETLGPGSSEKAPKGFLWANLLSKGIPPQNAQISLRNLGYCWFLQKLCHPIGMYKRKNNPGQLEKLPLRTIVLLVFWSINIDRVEHPVCRFPQDLYDGISPWFHICAATESMGQSTNTQNLSGFVQLRVPIKQTSNEHISPFSAVIGFCQHPKKDSPTGSSDTVTKCRLLPWWLERVWHLLRSKLDPSEKWACLEKGKETSWN